MSSITEPLADMLIRFLPEMVVVKNKLRLGDLPINNGGPGLFTHISALLKPNQTIEMYQRFGPELGAFRCPADCTALLNCLLRKAPPAKTKTSSWDQIYLTKEIPTPLSRLKLYTDVENPKTTFILDPDQKKTHRWNSGFAKERLMLVLMDSYGAWMQANSHACRVEYHPSREWMFGDVETDQAIFNTWTEAPWRTNWTPDPKATLPSEAEEFFKLLFADDESRVKCLQWLRDATFTRAEPILILTGIPGCGKNIFISEIAKRLVGSSNYTKASRGFGKSQFNSGIAGCRLHFFDEFALNDELRETLKEYHNAEATLERKNVEIGKAEKLYASIVLANNLKYKIKLDYSDRKFYVPALTMDPLLRHWSEEKVEAFIAKLDEPSYMQQIGSYLHTNFADGASAEFPKTEIFKEICINSYPADFRRFIDLCRVKEVVTARDMYRRSRRPADPYVIQQLIEQYQISFRTELATWHTDDEGDWYAISKIFSPAPEATNGNGLHSYGHHDDGEDLPIRHLPA